MEKIYIKKVDTDDSIYERTYKGIHVEYEVVYVFYFWDGFRINDLLPDLFTASWIQ